MVVRNMSAQGYQNSENLEEFLTGLRFEQRGKLDMVPINNINRTIRTKRQ